jgi:predicted DCC family thiol-disulfide oxidoreductase YuxK
MTESKSIIFFDGVCGFCQGAIRIFIKLDRHHRLFFAPLQGRYAQTHLPQSLIYPMTTMVFLYQGSLYTHSAAVVRIFWALGGIFKMIGYLIFIIPSPIRDLAYFMVSRVRYSLFGKTDACPIPPREVSKRFLD